MRLVHEVGVQAGSCRTGAAGTSLVQLVRGSEGLVWGSGGWFRRFVQEVGSGEDLQGRKRQAAG